MAVKKKPKKRASGWRLTKKLPDRLNALVRVFFRERDLTRALGAPPAETDIVAKHWILRDAKGRIAIINDDADRDRPAFQADERVPRGATRWVMEATNQTALASALAWLNTALTKVGAPEIVQAERRA